MYLIKTFFLTIFLILLVTEKNVKCENVLNKNVRASSILYGVASLSANLTNKSQCYKQLEHLYEAANYKNIWALKAMDASGQPGSGFIYGNNLWIGSHSQCSDISNTKKLEINYDKIPHLNATPYDYPPFAMGFAKAFIQHNNTLQYHTQLPLEFIIQLGLCVPKICSSEEISQILQLYFSKDYLSIQEVFELNLRVKNVKILKDDAIWIVFYTKTTLFLIIFGVIGILSIIGTIYDVRKHNREKIKDDFHPKKVFHTDQTDTNIKKSRCNDTLGSFLKCFSIYSNVKSLVNTKLSSDSVACIHGLRFFSMLWVIMVHAVFYQADYLENVPYAYRLSEDIFAQILSNSTYCVDTYLFLSGFLVSYLFFQQQKPTNGKETSTNVIKKLATFFMMIFNRFLRLTPVYLIVIVFSDVMFTYYRGSSSLESSEHPDILCEQYWWRNILYINNLFPRSQMCLSWSWYLSLDTQFFAIAIFLLIFSVIAFKTIAVITIGLIFVNIISTAWKSYTIGYVPTMDEQLVQLDAIYDLPWNRIGPYLVGVITGYILLVRMNKKLHLSERTRILLWMVFPLLNLWILFTLYTRNLTVTFSAIYMGISRTLWGVGLAWTIIACCTRNAPALEKFLSFSGWIPLSRLTYCAYLLNPIVSNMIYLGSESSYNASIAGFSVTILGIGTITFFLAFLFSMLFESPFILLTKMAFKNVTPTPKVPVNGNGQISA